MNKRILFLAAAVMTLLYSCKKNDSSPSPTVKPATGLYVLTEGGYGANDAALAYYDFTSAKVTTNFFASVNKRALGDVANDIAIYGSKMYIVVNNSNTVEIMEAATGKSLQQISLVDAANPYGYSPRHIAFANGKAYVTTYASKIVVIDTTTNAIAQYIDCRSGAEAIAIANNKMYVSVPGVYPHSGDSTISIIDLSSYKEVKTITVNQNPNLLQLDNYNHLYVICAGDYDKVPPSLAAININTDALISDDTTVQADNIAISGSKAYLYKSTYVDDSKSNVMTYDVQNVKLINRNFITDGTTVKYYYGINTDPATGDVYVVDALSSTSAQSKITCFTSAGKTKFNFTLADYGSYASKIVFLR